MKAFLKKTIIGISRIFLRIFLSRSKTEFIIKKYFRKYTLVLVRGYVTYNHGELVTTKNCDFMKEEAFIRAHEVGKRTGTWGSIDRPWRIYNACWSAYKAKSLEGDFVECGVDKGGLAKAIIAYIDFNSLNKKFYLLDTFNGMVDKQISAKEKEIGIRKDGWHKLGGYEDCYEFVKEIFTEDRVEIIRGEIPETLPQVKSEKIAFLSIDMNCAMPEIAASEYFWDKIVSGGVILLDDYGWKLHIEQKRAFDNFALKRNVKVLSLPTGQGMIFKP